MRVSSDTMRVSSDTMRVSSDTVRVSSDTVRVFQESFGTGSDTVMIHKPDVEALAQGAAKLAVSE